MDPIGTYKCPKCGRILDGSELHQIKLDEWTCGCTTTISTKISDDPKREHLRKEKTSQTISGKIADLNPFYVALGICFVTLVIILIFKS